MKTIFAALAGCLFLAVELTAQAQTTVGPPIVDRTYTGTVVQYSASGIATTGIFNLEIDAEGRISAQVQLSGVVSNFYGLVSLSINGSPAQTGTAFIHVGSGQAPLGVNRVKIPFLVQKAVAYGGMENQDGSTIVFRSHRADTLPVLE